MDLKTEYVSEEPNQPPTNNLDVIATQGPQVLHTHDLPPPLEGLALRELQYHTEGTPLETTIKKAPNLHATSHHPQSPLLPKNAHVSEALLDLKRSDRQKPHSVKLTSDSVVLEDLADAPIVNQWGIATHVTGPSGFLRIIAAMLLAMAPLQLDDDTNQHERTTISPTMP